MVKAKVGVIFFLFIILLTISMSSIASAERTVKSVEYPLDYVGMAAANTNYLQNINIQSPDGISNILSFEIELKGDFQASTEVIGRVSDGENIYDCSPGTWTTPTIDAPSYTISFDCTNLVNQANFKGGNITLGFRTNKVAMNIKPRIKMTYLNNPRGVVTVHGTEYSPGGLAKVWLQLIDVDGNEVDDALCTVDIYTPSNTQYIEDATMEALGEEGIYYYDLIAPQAQGVYPAVARCFYEAQQNKYLANASFTLFGSTTSGDYNSTLEDDGTVWQLQEAAANKRVVYNMNVSNFCPGYNESSLTGVTVGWHGQWDSTYPNDNVVISFYNYTTGVYQALPNSIAPSVAGEQVINNFIETSNITKSGIVANDSGIVSIQFDSDGLDAVRSFIDNDYFYVSCDTLTNPEWQEVKGSSELHVTSDKDYVTELQMGEMKNTTFLEDFTFHFTVGSQVSATTNDVDIELELFTPFPCDHVLNVSRNYGNGTVTDLAYAGSINSVGRCVITTELDLEPATNYDIEIRTENWWQQRIGYLKSEVGLNTEMINISCQNYVLSNNLTNFSIPVTGVTYGEDWLWHACESYLDIEYHFSKEIIPIFNAFLGINYNFTVAEMTSLEEQWAHLLSTDSQLEELAGSIADGLNLANSYSVGLIADPYPPTNPLYATYFSSISSSYLNYQILAALNAGTINVSIDESGLVDLIWAHDGTVAPELIAALGTNYSQIQLYVWNTSSRTLTSFSNFDVTVNTTNYNITEQDIWEYANRNLTYTPDQTNYSLIPLYVWNETSRTLTSFDYETMSDYVWNNTARELTLYQDVTNYTLAQFYIWNHTSRTLTDFSNFDVTVNTTNNNLTAADVWEYQFRNLSYIDFANMGLYVWNSTSRTLTDFNSFNITVNTTNVDITAKEIWEYASRNLTYTPDQTDYEQIGLYVWNSTTRDLTDFNFVVNTTNNNLTARDVWEYTLRNLTFTEDKTNYSLIPLYVWNKSSRTLTEFPYTEIAEYVWNSTTRALTTYEDVTNYTLAQLYVWNYTSRELTSFDNFNITVNTTNTDLTAAEVWDYQYRNLSYFDFATMALYVWNDSSRELTEFDFVVDTGLNNLTAKNVWEYVNRNLTYVDYETIGLYTWNSTTRSLTDFSFTVDTTNNNLTAQDVWEYTLRNLTFTEDKTNYSLIPLYVWNESARTLTEFPYTEISEYIWNYTTRALTSYEDVTNYTLAQLYIWNHTSRELTSFDNFDITVNTTNNNLTASDVWNYQFRNLSYFDFATIGLYVWNNTDRTLTNFNNFNITVNTTNVDLTAQEVWEYVNRNLTYTEDVTNYENIGLYTWNSTTRSLTDFSFTVETGLNNLTAQEVWEYTLRNLTFTEDKTNYSLIPLYVWNESARTLTEFPYVEIGEYIWNSTTRALTSYEDTTNYTLAQLYIWNHTTRELTSFDNFDITVNTTNTDLTAAEVWEYEFRNLSYFDFINMGLYVWNSTTRNLTEFGFTVDTTNVDLTAQQVWEYVNRNLTYTADPVNYEQIGLYVWNSTTRDLTDFNFVVNTTNNNLTAKDIWEYSLRNLTFTEDKTNYSLIPLYVWNESTRSLTEFPYLEISEYVWNATTRALTTYEDVTNYTLAQLYLWNYSDRTLTNFNNFNITVNTTNTDLTAAEVWDYQYRNLSYFDFGQVALYVWNETTRELTGFDFVVDTGLNNLSAKDVWEYVNRNLTYTEDATNYENIGLYTWNSTSRTLTDFAFTVDTTNNNLTAQQVWEYTLRNLTFTEDKTNYSLIPLYVWNESARTLTEFPYTEIAEYVWNATTRALTYYEDTTNYTLAQLYLWNYSDRTLTSFDGFNVTVNATTETLTAADIWNYQFRNLSYFDFASVGLYVWNTTTRNLTEFGFTVDTTNVDLTAQQVWEYVNRNLTYTEDATNYALIPVYVWNESTRTLTNFDNFDITVNTTNVDLTAQQVWEYASRNLTFTEDKTNYSLIPLYIWNETTRSLTEFPYVEIGEYIWNSTTRALTQYEDTTNYTLAQLYLWNYSDRTLTNFNNFNITVNTTNTDLTAAEVWDYQYRNLSYFDFGQVALYVWNESSRTLTDFNFVVDTGLNNFSAKDVWEYVNRNLTYTPDQTNYEQIGLYVWNSTTRELTGFDFVVDTGLNNLTTKDIWEYQLRNLTFTEDKTNYSLIPLYVWNESARTITEFPYETISQYVWNETTRALTSYEDTTNYTLAQLYLWNYSDRTLTSFDNFNITVNTTNTDLTAAEVWDYQYRNLSYFDFGQMALYVWNSTTRELTAFGFTVDTTNVDLTAEQVWEYTNRNLTFTEDKVNYSQIPLYVWNESSRSLTSFSNFDITVNTTNYNLTEQAIWEFANRNLTFYEDTTNYTQIPLYVWNESTRTLTESLLSYTDIAQYVWNFTTRELTTNISKIVWEYHARNLTYINTSAVVNTTQIAEDVWNYTNREITNLDTNSIASATWSYPVRNLTYYNNTLNELDTPDPPSDFSGQSGGANAVPDDDTEPEPEPSGDYVADDVVEDAEYSYARKVVEYEWLEGKQNVFYVETYDDRGNEIDVQSIKQVNSSEELELISIDKLGTGLYRFLYNLTDGSLITGQSTFEITDFENNTYEEEVFVRIGSRTRVEELTDNIVGKSQNIWERLLADKIFTTFVTLSILFSIFMFVLLLAFISKRRK